MASGPLPLPAGWWQLPAEELRGLLGSGEGGLATAAAAGRLAAYGPNRLQAPPARRLAGELARRLRSPLVLVLLAAGAVSLATGATASAWILCAIVFLSVLVDRFQEGHAESAAARLAARAALTVRVLRDGREQAVPAEEVVPGDLVRLAAGAQVPADGVLLAATDFFVQQAALTGEPFPVEKKAGSVAAGTIEDAPGVLFMGSSVISGNGLLLACRTGAATGMGQLARVVAADPGELAFERDLRQFGNFILRTAVFLVLFVVLAGGLLHRPWLETLMFALALAVGITPELLPMVVTVSLARGGQRLAAQEVIVKRMSAIHNLGSMDVLCTDKTGTLTEAKIALVRHVDCAGRDSPSVLENAFLNSHFETGLRTPLEDAVLAHGGFDVQAWRKIDEVPFGFERRRVSVLVEGPGGRRLCLKGAPADVLAVCDRWDDAGAARPWSAAARAQAEATLAQLEGEGLRVLAVAWKAVPATLEDAGLQDEAALVFAGFAAFLDPPKADAKEAVRGLHAKGVHLKVLTGDGERVTRHLCEALAIPVRGVLLGAEAAVLDDRALGLRAQRANLFCRMDPIQKNRVIRALRARGHVVGYLGDGINDAPALHGADVGISVDGAAESARAAADLILLRHSLKVLSAAVTEGRRTFANTRKYILLGTSSSFGNMISMAAAAVLLPFLPMLPVQILLNNLLYDLVSATLPLDAVEAREVARPQHWDIGGIRRFMLTVGPVSSVFDLLTFWILLRVLSATPEQFRSGWFVASVATQVLAVFVIRSRAAPWASRSHPALVWAAAAVLAIAFVLPYTPAAALFGLVPLPWTFLAAVAGLTAAYLALLESVKQRVMSGQASSRPTTARAYR